MVEYEYDLVFSYSHEDEELVKDIEIRLSEKGWKCIRLHHKLKEMSLKERINDIFMKRARFIMVFISDYYNVLKSKRISLELETARKRYSKERYHEFFLPIVLY